MSLEHWLIYVSVVALIVVTPGPAAALCLSHGVVHGRTRTLMTVLGLVSSSLTLIALSSFGLGAILATSSTLFAIVKYVGAAYLIYLGVSIWRAPEPQEGPSEVTSTSAPADRLSLRRLFVTGFLVGISNPKDLLFFGALFPQFIEPGPTAMQQLLILSSTWVTVAFAIMALYAALGSKFASRMQGISARRALNKVTGGVFVAAGAALAWAKR
jgi:threonine/homoserine/homoserine lactone efflux protein